MDVTTSRGTFQKFKLKFVNFCKAQQLMPPPTLRRSSARKSNINSTLAVSVFIGIQRQAQADEAHPHPSPMSHFCDLDKSSSRSARASTLYPPVPFTPHPPLSIPKDCKAGHAESDPYHCVWFDAFHCCTFALEKERCSGWMNIAEAEWFVNWSLKFTPRFDYRF